MKRHQFFVGLLLLAVALPCIGWAGPPQPYQVGESLPAVILKDQFDVPLPLDAKVRSLVFSREMASKDMIEALLTDEGAGFLAEHEAVYLADISKMPSLITKMFALPKMKEYPFRLFLDLDGSLTARIPVQAGKVTLLFLDDRQIQAIRYIADKAELKAELSRGSLP